MQNSRHERKVCSAIRKFHSAQLSFLLDILKDLEDPINLTRANEGTASLQKILVDAAGDLPAYDQRQYETVKSIV